MSVNEHLREHVTSVGFHLTLTKNMTRVLVLVAWAESQTKKSAVPQLRASDVFNTIFRTNLTGGSYMNAVQSLRMRGLVAPGYGVTLTRAGELVAEVLKEAGIYQEQLSLLQLCDTEQVGVTA